MSEIKPYYQDQYTTLYCGDCNEVMDSLGEFDLVIADPPYGIGWAGSMALGKKSARWKQHKGGWDESRPSDEVILKAVGKGAKAIVWGGNYFPCLPVSGGWFVWNKMQRNFSMGDGELAWTNCLNTVRIFDLSRPEAVRDGKRHPTQKSLSLMRWCIKQANGPTSILDPFSGSGTVLVAAKLDGIRAVGIEISEEYCEVIAKRLSQGVLF